MLLNDRVMPRTKHVLKRIGAALATDGKRLKELFEEMNKHAESYNRYLELQRESEALEESARRLTALLGPNGFRRALRGDKSDTIEGMFGSAFRPKEMRDKAALWEHVAQYLRFVSEARIGQILGFLSQLGIDASRQAVESAVGTHSKVFVIRKRGGEKFIALASPRLQAI